MKVVLFFLGALLVSVGAEAAQISIKGSPHDISGGTGEICIYCHTPHNSAIAVPLWNRMNPCNGESWLYKTSATLTAATKASAFSEDSISLFCMSCHDGSIALSAVVNANDETNNHMTNPAVNSTAGALAATNPKNLKHDLSNTHPIGFNYVTAQGEDSGLREAGAVLVLFKSKDAADGKTTSQSFLYGSNYQTFECASCHRVHDPGTSTNFLRIENEQSDLCLACHIK